MRPVGFVAGWVLLGLFGLPGSTAGQSPAFEARLGLAWHGSAPCGYLGRNRGIALGIEARTRGSWIVSVAVDMMGDWSVGCFDVGRPAVDYEGQRVDIRGDTGPGLGRGRLAIGRTIVVGRIRSSLTAGVGLVPSIIDYGREGRDFSWQPWYGGTLTVRLPGTGAGVQLELGRHRLTQRYYLEDTSILAAEVHDWEHLIRAGFSFPL